MEAARGGAGTRSNRLLYNQEPVAPGAPGAAAAFAPSPGKATESTGETCYTSGFLLPRAFCTRWEG